VAVSPSLSDLVSSVVSPLFHSMVSSASDVVSVSVAATCFVYAPSLTTTSTVMFKFLCFSVF